MSRAQAQARALLLLRSKSSGTSGQFQSMETYQSDPHRFCVDYFGETYTQDVIRVMESVRDNPVTIAKSANATGKSHGAARIAAWFYKCFPGAQVYTTAAPPERNLKKILWGEIGSLVEKHSAIFSQDRITQDLNIQRDALSFITGVTIPMSGTPEQREAKFSGKHAPYLLFIVDEGDAVPPEVYKGIESCMSGGFARLLVMFNPRGEYGPVALMEKKRLGNVVSLSAMVHPNVVSGEDKIPGAVNRETTVRRINEWSRPLAPGEMQDNECFEVPEYLVGISARSHSGEIYPGLPEGWRKVTNPAFFYMVLGQYPPQAETQLISRAWVDAAVSRWLTYVAMNGERPPVYTGLAGLDVAEYGKDRNILTCRWGGYVEHPVGWQGLDPDSTAIKADSYVRGREGTLTVMVDATGIGSGVAPRMQRLGSNAESVKVAAAPTYSTELGDFLQMRDQLWWSCREWLRTDPGAMLPPDDELAEELCAPLYSVVGSKIKVTAKDTLREMIGRSTDKADSLCLTFADNAAVSFALGISPFKRGA